MHSGPGAVERSEAGAGRRHADYSRLGFAGLVCAVVFAACVAGVLTRPWGFLAAIWPANAILLGLLIRHSNLVSPVVWLSALVGYVVADLLTGGSFLFTLWLTAANLSGVAAAYLLFMRLQPADRQLQRPLSMLYLLAACTIAAVVAACVGGPAAPPMFGKTVVAGLAFWFTTELVNYIIVLPLVLTAPPLRQWHDALGRAAQAVRASPVRLLPFTVLVLVTAASLTFDGPGASMFPIPVLLWCALSYSFFATSAISLLFCATVMIAASAGLTPLTPSDNFIDASASYRLGIALLALGPLTAASINAARAELLRSLDHAANHDYLTGILARSAFLSRAARMLDQRPAPGAAVLMLDIDHFKRINDHHGHAAGDQVLISVTRMMAASLRAGDLIGRLGGEEFAVLLPGISIEEASSLSERLRSVVEQARVVLDDGTGLQVTVSIGLVYCPAPTTAPLPALLSVADKQLYEAKSGGRNRIRISATLDA